MWRWSLGRSRLCQSPVADLRVCAGLGGRCTGRAPEPRDPLGLQCPGESRALLPEPSACCKALGTLPTASSPQGHPALTRAPSSNTHPVPLPWGSWFARGHPGLPHRDGWAQVAQNAVPGTLQIQQMPWEWWLIPRGALSPSPCDAPCHRLREGSTPSAAVPAVHRAWGHAAMPLEWEWAGDSQHRPRDTPNVGLGQDAAPGSAPVLDGGRKAIQMEMPCC